MQIPLKQEPCYLLGNLLGPFTKIAFSRRSDVRTHFYDEGPFPHSADDLLGKLILPAHAANQSFVADGAERRAILAAFRGIGRKLAAWILHGIHFDSQAGVRRTLLVSEFAGGVRVVCAGACDGKGDRSFQHTGGGRGIEPGAVFTGLA